MKINDVFFKVFIIYMRKSRKKDSGVSYETQLTRCIDEIKRVYGNDVKIIKFIDGEKSGDDPNRPQYLEMKEFIRSNGGCKLYAYSASRLVRDVIEGGELAVFLRENKCELNIYGSGDIKINTPAGTSMFHKMCIDAETQLNDTKQNQAENAYQKARLSICNGGQAPFGYKSVKHAIILNNSVINAPYYEVIDHEIEIVKEIYDLYYKYRSASKVASILQNRDVSGKYNNIISKSTIISVLTNPINVKTDEKVVEFYRTLGFEIGQVQYGKRGLTYGKKSNAIFLSDDYRGKYFFTEKYEGIIDSDRWLEIQEIYRENSKKAPKKGKSKTNSLGDILKCRCGSDMKIASIKKDKDGKKVVYYCCSTKCGNKNANGSKIEEIILNQVLDIDYERLFKAILVNLDSTINKLYGNLKNMQKEKSYLVNSYNKKFYHLDLIEKNDENKSLSYSKGIDDLMSRIKTTDEKIEETQNKIKELKKELSRKIEDFKLRANKENILLELNVYYKKMLLAKVAEEIVWDGDTKSINIKKVK